VEERREVEIANNENKIVGIVEGPLATVNRREQRRVRKNSKTK